jgi:protein-ribulosamine 3-kinase
LRISSLVQQKLSETFNSFNGELKFSSVGGGSINETWRISWPGHQAFCKINSATKFPRLFKKEKLGLEFIQKHERIKSASVIDCFETSDEQVLILGWIEEGERSQSFWKKFGEHLAALHSEWNERFGFEEDNYMGSVPQQNQWSARWTEFFISQRLEPLISKCSQQRLLSIDLIRQFERLYDVLPSVFDDKQKPALVHGDLWSGNFMCNKNSEPVLIDPAVYFGHPSVDLGMTTLFGGFAKEFYDAYHYHSPFPTNHREQWEICNLYPLLIHLLLFGRSYLGQIERIVNEFV